MAQIEGLEGQPVVTSNMPETKLDPVVNPSRASVAKPMPTGPDANGYDASMDTFLNSTNDPSKQMSALEMNNQEKKSDAMSAIDGLGAKYQKAAQFAQKAGVAAPKLPDILQGTQYDPNPRYSGGGGERMPQGAPQLDLSDLEKERPGAPQDPNAFVRGKMNINPNENPNAMMAPMDKQLLSQYNQNAAQQNAVLASTMAANRAQDEVMKNYQQNQEASDLQWKNKEADRKIQLDNATADIDKTRQNYMAMKEDPNHFWDSRSTGQKLSVAIGAILSGIGSGLTGKQDNYMNLVQGYIDRDIQAQRQNKAAAKDDLSAKESMYNKYYTLYKDDQAAYFATRAAGLQQVQLQIDAQAKKVNNAYVGANAAKTIGELEIAKQKAVADFQNRIKLNQLGGSQTDAAHKLNTIMSVLPDEQKKAASEEFAKNQMHQKGVSDLEDIYNKYSTDTNAVGRAYGSDRTKTLDAQIRGVLTQAMDLKTMKPEAVEAMIKPFLPDAKDVTEADLAEKLQGAKELINRFKPQTPILDQYGLGSNASPIKKYGSAKPM